MRFASRSIPGGRPETGLPPPGPGKEDGAPSDLKEISAGAAGAAREGRSPNMGMQAQTRTRILIFGWHGEPLDTVRVWVAPAWSEVVGGDNPNHQKAGIPRRTSESHATSCPT